VARKSHQVLLPRSSLRRLLLRLARTPIDLDRLGLIAVRSQHHRHVPTVLLGGGLHEAKLRHIVGQPLQQPETQLRSGLLTTPEHDGDLDLVTVLEEARESVALVARIADGPGYRRVVEHLGDVLVAPSEEAPDDAWRQLTGSLGLPEAPTVGQQVSVSVSKAPALSGRVERFQSRLMTLLLDAPSRGIGVVGIESFADKGFPMVYLYLFGPAADDAVQQAQPTWQDWIERTFDGA